MDSLQIKEPSQNNTVKQSEELAKAQAVVSVQLSAPYPLYCRYKIFSKADLIRGHGFIVSDN